MYCVRIEDGTGQTDQTDRHLSQACACENREGVCEKGPLHIGRLVIPHAGQVPRSSHSHPPTPTTRKSLRQSTQTPSTPHTHSHAHTHLHTHTDPFIAILLARFNPTHPHNSSTFAHAHPPLPRAHPLPGILVRLHPYMYLDNLRRPGLVRTYVAWWMAHVLFTRHT